MSGSRLLVRNNEIIHAPVSEDEMVMLCVDSGLYYSLNPVGRRLWELLEEPRTLDELRATICGEFEVDEATCEPDIQAFLGDMMQNGLIRDTQTAAT